MSIDLDELARDAVVAAPTKTPDVETLRTRVKQRRRNRRVLTIALATPVITLATLGAWSVADRDSRSTQVVAAGGDMQPVSTTSPTQAAPSQSEADAASDQIIPALARLPLEARVHQVDELGSGPTRVDTNEGTWIISQPLVDPAELTNSCILGDPDGIYGLERVCLNDYAEILLLAHGTGQIIRAYPFPGLEPRSLQATSDALYCISQGDGAVPDSMLCRIDLESLDATVRVFPQKDNDITGEGGTAFPPGSWMPSTWTVNEPTELVLWENLDATDTGITISGWGGSATVDPDTLALVTINKSASG